MQFVDTLDARLQLGPGGVALGHRLAAFLDAQQVAVEVAPLAALEHHQLFGGVRLMQPLADHPVEVGAEHLAVADLEQLAGHELAARGIHRQAAGRQTGPRHFLGLHQLAGDQLGRLAGHTVFGFQHVGRPEVAETAHGNHRQQTEGHDHRDGDATAGHPHPGRAALEPGFEVFLFHVHGRLPSRVLERGVFLAQAGANQLCQGIHHEGEGQ
ncbi:hypothetical protein D9M71_498980 [compost metagenome]